MSPPKSIWTRVLRVQIDIFNFSASCVFSSICSVLGSIFASKGSPRPPLEAVCPPSFSTFFLSCRAVLAQTAPRPPKTASRRPQDPPRHPKMTPKTLQDPPQDPPVHPYIQLSVQILRFIGGVFQPGPPKAAKREPSWCQKRAKMEQNGGQQACQEGSKNRMHKRSQLGANWGKVRSRLRRGHRSQEHSLS